MVNINEAQLTRWAQRCLQVSHLNTLVQRAIKDGDKLVACHYTDRARRRACELLDEMIAAGAEDPRAPGLPR